MEKMNKETKSYLRFLKTMLIRYKLISVSVTNEPFIIREHPNLERIILPDKKKVIFEFDVRRK